MECHVAQEGTRIPSDLLEAESVKRFLPLFLVFVLKFDGGARPADLVPVRRPLAHHEQKGTLT